MTLRGLVVLVTWGLCCCCARAESRDDAAALQAQIDAAAAANGAGYVNVPAGVYELKRPLLVTNCVSLALHPQALLKAVAEMEYLVVWDGQWNRVVGSLPRNDNKFITGGQFDGAGRASCLLLTNCWHMTLRDITFLNGRTFGLRLTRGNEVFGSNLNFRNRMRGLEGNTALKLETSDCHFTDVVAVDYTTGIHADWGANRFTRCHVWNGSLRNATGDGPDEAIERSVAFRIDGDGHIFRDCYADSAKIGFLIAGRDIRLAGCSFYSNQELARLDDITVIKTCKPDVNVIVSECSFTKSAAHMTLHEGEGKLVWRDCLYPGWEDVEIQERRSLQSDGSQYIQTDYYVKPTTKVVVDFEYADVENVAGTYILGARTRSSADGGLSCSFYHQTSGAQAWTFHENGGELWFSSRTPELGKRYLLTLDYPNDSVTRYIDGQPDTSRKMSDKTSGLTKAGSYPQAVFANNSWGKAENFSKIKLYALRYYEDGELVRDYIPYLQKGVAGLKDRVTGVFHVSATDSPFAYGGDIASDATEPYLQSDGTQAILLDYYANPKTRVVVDYEYLDTNVQYVSVFGARSKGSSDCGLSCSVSHQKGGAIAWSFHEDGGERWFNANAAQLGVRYELSLDCPGDSVAKYVDGKRESSCAMSQFSSNVTQTAKYPQAVFAYNKCGELTGLSKIRLYSLKYFEDGKLVRDYAPYVQNGVAGLRDRKSGAFFAPARGGLAFGGDIESDSPVAYEAYLESDGTQAILTDYYAKPTTKVVVDCEYVAIEPSACLFGARTSNSSQGGLSCAIYHLNSTAQAWSFHENGGNRWYGSLLPVLGSRYVLSVDYPNDLAEKCVDGVVRNSEKMTTQTSGVTANAVYPQAIFANNSWGKIADNSKIRLHSLKYYENGALVRQYLPYKSGDVLGLYETETKTVLVNSASGANPFKIGGAGADGSRLKLLVKPADTMAKRSRSQILSAYAPGAVSYRWFCNDVEVAGESKAELDVAWNGVGGTDTYRVVPVFETFGRKVEGEVATCRFCHDVPGTTVLVQ